MDSLCHLAELTTNDIRLAGGKAWNLSRMIRAGFPVPEGYVVFNFANLHEQRVRSAIFQAFDNLNVEEVAVRSSAGKEDSRERSYAGSFASFLSVHRSNLLEKITQVRESSLGLSEEINHELGVVIQPMIKGQVSGVCFSRNPLAAGNDILIEAVCGLAEGLVSGELTPERYEVRRMGFDIRRSGRRPDRFTNGFLLSNRDVKQLVKLTQELEMLFDCAVDVEWTIRDGEVHLLQCRPITVLGQAGPESRNQPYHYFWSTTEPMWAMDLGFRTRSALLPPHYQARTLWTFDDHLYAKIGSVYEYHVNAEQRADFHPHADEVDGFLNGAESILEQQDLFFHKLENLPVCHMEPRELVLLLDEACRFYCRMIGLYSATSSQISSLLIHEMCRTLEIDSPLPLLELPQPDLMEVEQRDWQLLCQREFSDERTLAHVRKYPYLALNLHSYDAVLTQMRDVYEHARRNGIRLGGLRTQAERHKLLQEQQALLRKFPNARPLVERCHRMALARMHIKRGWAGLGFFLIPFFTEVSARSKEPLATLMELYRVEDINRLILEGQPLSSVTREQRSLACVWHMKGGRMRELEGVTAEIYLREITNIVPEGSLRGTVASRGTAQGKVFVLICNDAQSMREGRRSFEDGDILVTEMAQPSMIDIISRSSAVITNEGGLLSHAAIVCRELRIPCVVGTISATKILTSGQRVEITENGEIRVEKG